MTSWAMSFGLVAPEVKQEPTFIKKYDEKETAYVEPDEPVFKHRAKRDPDSYRNHVRTVDKKRLKALILDQYNKYQGNENVRNLYNLMCADNLLISYTGGVVSLKTYYEYIAELRDETDDIKESSQIFKEKENLVIKYHHQGKTRDEIMILANTNMQHYYRVMRKHNLLKKKYR